MEWLHVIVATASVTLSKKGGDARRVMQEIDGTLRSPPMR